MYKRIGEIIKECRSYTNMTQQELADKAFLSLDTIKSYETGRVKSIPERNIELIADACLTPWLMHKFMWLTSGLYRRVMQEQGDFRKSHAETTINLVRQIDELQKHAPSLLDYACGRVNSLSGSATDCLLSMHTILTTYTLKIKEKAAPARATNS